VPDGGLEGLYLSTWNNFVAIIISTVMCCDACNVHVTTLVFTEFMFTVRQEAQLLQRERASAVITPFKFIQSHWFWYQSKAHMRLPISE